MTGETHDGPSPEHQRVIEACTAFEGLPGRTLLELVGRMHRRAWQEGDLIIRQGDSGDWVAALVEGTASVVVHTASSPSQTVATIGPSEFVGEMALVTRLPRTADVVAATDVLGYVLSAAEFEEVAAMHPELGMALTHVMADRLGRGDFDGLAGKAMGHYRIVRCVGRGRMGSVYEAVDEGTGQRVALKMMNHRLLYDRSALMRFQREADVLKSVSHPNIARVQERFHAFRTYFISMEFCDGPTLEQMIEDRGSLGEEETKRIIGQVATALAFIHSHGVVHRDVKPPNLIITRGGILKLADFGLAKNTVDTAATDITETRTVMGTPHYMPPEALAAGEAGAPGDVYALGCSALACLMGRGPFTQATYSELLQAKWDFRAPSAVELGISPETHRFIEAAIDVDPARRPQDLSAVAAWAG